MNTVVEYQARMADSRDVDAAYAFCESLARRHYENFPVASRLLPSRLRRPVAALYAFARIADDFADEAEYQAVRKERLEEWRSRLWAAAKGGSDHPVFVALGDAMKRLDLPVQPFDDLLSAFLQDVDKSRYASFDEVLDYCSRSANPVGRIVLMIHGYRDEERFRMSDALCTALQLTNFWQDVSVDLKKDRIYIPQDDLAGVGYSDADLRMGVVNDKFLSLMKLQWKRARALFDEGRRLPETLSWPLSWEIRLTWLGGTEVLRKIRKAGYDTLRSRPALSKWDWLPLIARTLVAR